MSLPRGVQGQGQHGSKGGHKPQTRNGSGNNRSKSPRSHPFVTTGGSLSNFESTALRQMVRIYRSVDFKCWSPVSQRQKEDEVKHQYCESLKGDKRGIYLVWKVWDHVKETAWKLAEDPTFDPNTGSAAFNVGEAFGLNTGADARQGLAQAAYQQSASVSQGVGANVPGNVGGAAYSSIPDLNSGTSSSRGGPTNPNDALADGRSVAQDSIGQWASRLLNTAGVNEYQQYVEDERRRQANREAFIQDRQDSAGEGLQKACHGSASPADATYGASYSVVGDRSNEPRDGGVLTEYDRDPDVLRDRIDDVGRENARLKKQVEEMAKYVNEEKEAWERYTSNLQQGFAEERLRMEGDFEARMA